LGAVPLAASLFGLSLLTGCGTQAIQVSEAAVTDRPDARVTGWGADDPPRLVFSPEDEEVTVKVRFAFNYRAVYEWYTIEWLAPDGSPYKVVSRRTEFGSHRDLQASLGVRGKMASRMPGLWRVRVWLQGREGAPNRLLVARLFRIQTPQEAGIDVALTRVDPPPADAERPLAGGAGRTPEVAAARVPAAAAPASAGRPAAPPAPADAGQATAALTDGLLLPPGVLLPASASGGGAPAAPARPPGDTGGPAPPPEGKESVAALPDGLLQPLGLLLPTPAPGTPEPVPPGKDATAPRSPPAALASVSTAPPAGGSRPGPVSPPPGRQAAAPQGVVAQTATGVDSVTLESRPAPPGATRGVPPRRRWEGCPPLYYPPGPGCVEQSPQE
jgi:hypothetical protein